MNKFMLSAPDNEREVYVNLISSPAGRYLNRRPYVINLIKEIIGSLKLSGERIVVEKDLGRKIGTTDIVMTSDKDTIYYAQQAKTDVFSRFAKNRYPQPSQMLTVVFIKDEDGNYQLQDTWIGDASPPFPGDEHETKKSKSYWETHALVHEAQVIQSKSITRDCPY